MTTKNNLTVVETGKYYQSSSRRQHIRKYQLTKWSTLFIALVVALMTASLIFTINRRAERSNQTQILLIYIKEQLTQTNALKWQVITEKKLSYDLFAKVQDAHIQAHFINQKLEAIEPTKLKLKNFSQLYKKYDIAVEEEFKLFAAGQITKAVIIDEEEVEPTYDKLSNEIIKLDAHYSNQKHQASQIAERGSVLALLVSAGLISVLFRKFIQAGRVAQLAVAEQKIMSQSEERFRSLVQNASDVIIVINAETGITYVTVSAQRVLGYLPEDLVGTNVWNLVDTNNTVQLQNFVKDCLQAPGVTQLLELPFLHQEGHLCYVELIGNNLLSNPHVNGIVLTLRDINERRQAVEILRYHAFHDSLTNLPNRALFTEHLQQAVKQAKSNKDYTFAVLFLDLDHFKLVNDSFGHKMGDELLCAVARRVEACLSVGDTIARLGGDEFALLLYSIQDINQVQDVAKRIKQELSIPFHLNGHELFISTSIGIALGSLANSWLDDILRNADIAMYHAKTLGRATYEVFDKIMHVQVAQRLQLETDLQRAVAQQEFIVYYQPIVSLKTRRIAGFEALVRWQHPTCGLVSPADFIPLAEETGLIIPIGWWVMREACRQMQVWQTQFPNNLPLTISVNISSKQFSQPNFINQIRQILQESGLSPRFFKLEITESVVAENAESVIPTLTQLQALGLQISMDNFGTAYSSLNYLYRLPINTLKIDRSFIRNLNIEVEKVELIQTIVALAWNLGINVVAEGVETKKQMYQLQMLKCDYGQGYLFSEPLNSEMAQALIAEDFPLRQLLLKATSSADV